VPTPCSEILTKARHCCRHYT